MVGTLDSIHEIFNSNFAVGIIHEKKMKSIVKKMYYT